MKKSLILVLSSAMVLSGCDTYTGSGAYAGASFGSILGSAIGGLSDGPRGSDIGTIIGMAGGAIVGAAIGQQTDQRRNEAAVASEARRAERIYQRQQQQDQSGQSRNGSSYQQQGDDSYQQYGNNSQVQSNGNNSSSQEDVEGSGFNKENYHDAADTLVFPFGKEETFLVYYLPEGQETILPVVYNDMAKEILNSKAKDVSIALLGSSEYGYDETKNIFEQEKWLKHLVATNPTLNIHFVVTDDDHRPQQGKHMSDGPVSAEEETVDERAIPKDLTHHLVTIDLDRLHSYREYFAAYIDGRSTSKEFIRSATDQGILDARDLGYSLAYYLQPNWMKTSKKFTSLRRISVTSSIRGKRTRRNKYENSVTPVALFFTIEGKINRKEVVYANHRE
jgi:outer membrane lipoprotein SlyB